MKQQAVSGLSNVPYQDFACERIEVASSQFTLLEHFNPRKHSPVSMQLSVRLSHARINFF